MPVVQMHKFSLLWFTCLLVINIEVGTISPPFGMTLFVMKGVAPADTTTKDLYKAAIWFCMMDVIVIGLVMAFPILVLWLPGGGV